MHTPLPWELIRQGDGSNFIARRVEDDSITGMHLRLVAHILRRKDSAVEDEANANFIDRAVNGHAKLIEALKEARGFISIVECEEGLTVDKLVEQINTALGEVGEF